MPNVNAPKKVSDEQLLQNLRTKVLPELKAVLDVANKTFMNGDNLGRDGMILSLQAAILYMEATAPHFKKAGLLTPLTMLLYGLRSLNSGKPPAFVKVTKKYATVRANDIRLAVQGMAAAALHILIRNKTMTATDAGRAISAELQKADFLMGGQKSVSLRALRLWQTKARVSPQSPRGKSYHWLIKANFDFDNGKTLKANVFEILRYAISQYRAGDA